MATSLPDVVPYVYYDDAAAALDFLVRAFGFEELDAVRDDDGTVWHATLRVGTALVMIGPGMAEFGTRAVEDHRLATSRIHVLVEDFDTHHDRARSVGATIHTDPHTGPAGARIYIATDPGGHQWIFAERSAS